MSEGAKGTPASLRDLLTARQEIDEIEGIQAQLADRQWDEHVARLRFTELVKASDELTDIEKTGWLLSVDSEDPEIAAAGFIDKLLRVEELVGRPDTPLVYVRFEGGRIATMFRTDGSGMSLGVGSVNGVEIGVNEEPGCFRLPSMKSSILAEAITEPEEAETVDITAHHNSTYYSGGHHKNVLIVGDKAIKAYFERLLDKEERGGQLQIQLQSQWIEGLLSQIPGDAKDFLADSERLTQWYEEMRASRVNLAAEHLLSQQSNLYPLPNTSPEYIQYLTDFYRIGYEEIRAKALEVYDESAAKIRQRLESAQPPLVTDSDKSRFERSRRH